MRHEQKFPEIVAPVAQKTILLIEDHPVFSMIMMHAISRYTPHQVVHLVEGSQVLQVIEESRPDLLVLDYNLPGLNGIEIYDLVHSTEGLEDIPAVMVSADLPYGEIKKRNIPGLVKPCGTNEFLHLLEKVLG